VHPIKKIARIYVAVEAVTAQSSRGEFLVATRFSVTIFWATLDRSYDEFLGTNIWCRCSQPLMTATACPFGFAGSMSQCMSSLCNCYKHKKKPLCCPEILFGRLESPTILFDHSHGALLIALYYTGIIIYILLSNHPLPLLSRQPLGRPVLPRNMLPRQSIMQILSPFINFSISIWFGSVCSSEERYDTFSFHESVSEGANPLTHYRKESI